MHRGLASILDVLERNLQIRQLGVCEVWRTTPYFRECWFSMLVQTVSVDLRVACSYDD